MWTNYLKAIELDGPLSTNLKTALIIGASRGIGLGLAQAYLAEGWRVIATRRCESTGGLAALRRASGDRLVIEDLDVTDDAGIVALRRRLAHEKLDLLLVSAGTIDAAGHPVGRVPTEEFNRLMTTNALGPLRIIEVFADSVREDGVIAAMSSVLGSVAGNTTGGYEVYRASKAALNTLLRSFAARKPERTVLALHPGWVRTDMGGAEAAIDVAESVKGLICVVAAQAGRPGCRYLDYAGETIPW